MDLRRSLLDLQSLMKERPRVTMWVCIGVVTFVLVIVLTMSGRSRQHYPSSDASTSSGKIYYTADEGKTFEVGPWTLVPPYEKNGKTFVRMHKFQDVKGIKIGYLEKYADETHKMLMAEEEGRPREIKMDELGFSGRVVKRPGDENWIPRTSEEGKAIVEVMTSDGRGRANPVFPK